MSNNKLFGVYLGGSAPRSNIELHDVVFVVAEKIEDAYEELMSLWFGSIDGLHIDSWIHLSIIDGHKITLSDIPPKNSLKLYFINMGAYASGKFIEIHSNEFYVSEDKRDVIKRARDGLLKGSLQVHRDYIYEVDECLEVEKVGKFYIHLEQTNEPSIFEPVNAYHLIPKVLVKEYKEKMNLS